MKKLSFLLAISFLIVCIGGCHAGVPDNTQPAKTGAESEPFPTSEPLDTQAPSQSVEETDATQATDPAPTEESISEGVPTEQPEAAVPYLETIKRADQPIFSGPGYDYDYVATVEIAGIYTIVEEAWDCEGNLWGRLKSGIGWIDLTDARSEETAQAPISAGFADDTLLESGNYHHCIADASEYMVQIALRASEVLTNVALVSLQYSESGYEVAEALFTLPELTPDKPLVADVAFPGDMSTYGISFTDSSGAMRYYTITTSLRNGALILSEYEP